MRHLSIAVIIVFVVAVAAAEAADVVDQSNTGVDLSANTLAITNNPSSEQKLAQTFTVGVVGRLREIRIPVACGSGRLDVKIVNVDASGAPGSTVLSSTSIRANRLPDKVEGEFVSIHVRGRVNVAIGQRLAFTLANTSGSCGLARAAAGDTYSGGAGYFDARPNPPGWTELSGAATDLAFETVVRE